MRQTLALCALLLCANCGDDTNNSGGVDLAVTLDMTAGPNLAVRTPNGVACGTTSCASGQSCCVTTSGNMATGATCIASGAACTGGSTLACDGPEDCSAAGSPYCCGSIKLSGGGSPDAGVAFNGGDSSCTATCNIGGGLGGGPLTTRLCHADVDCTGLSVPITNAPAVCCHSAAAPGLQFCAAAISLGAVNIVCP